MYDIVAVGASWGGLDAMAVVLGLLPSTFAVPVVLVQHRGPWPSTLVPVLGDHTALRVSEAGDKDPLRAGTVHVAPPDYHLLVERGRLVLSTDPLVHYSRPSIDVLFASVADAYRTTAIGVVLTGTGRDGAAGLAEVARRGGHAIVEDPATAAEPAMPSAAQRAAPGAEVLVLRNVASRLVELCAASPAAGPRR